MSDFIEERENYVDELIEEINNKMKDVNRSARKCVEMELEGVNLALCQQINLWQTYKVVEQQVDKAEGVMNDHRVNIERELRNGEAMLNNWEALEERERELANIKTRLSHEIAKSKEEAKRLIQAKEKRNQSYGSQQRVS